MPTDPAGATRAPRSRRPRAWCTGVVLAGGMATRYGGRPKGLERVDGVRIIDRVVAALRPATDDILLIANDPEAPTWVPGLRVATDVRPGVGSLGGLHAALVRAGSPVLVVAWDMPFVSRDLLEALRTLGEQGADVAVPALDPGDWLEPLCAYYSPDCIPAIEHRLDAGDRRVISFYDSMRVARLNPAAIAQFGDPAHLFLSVNTPDDLVRADRSVARALG
jgi:molybdopterin-guanine dinucleotide biosynthesis protein A